MGFFLFKKKSNRKLYEKFQAYKHLLSKCVMDLVPVKAPPNQQTKKGCFEIRVFLIGLKISKIFDFGKISVKTRLRAPCETFHIVKKVENFLSKLKYSTIFF